VVNCPSRPSPTDKPWGVGFLAWSVDVETIGQAIDRGPQAVMLSFGDPVPLAEPVHQAGITLIVQVTDLGEARRALEAGADVLVAQGSEAGGHGGRRATLPFVPAVVDLAAPVPVLAAGGIADGRGLAAALVLGAAGALIGTRFQASLEALVRFHSPSRSTPDAILAAPFPRRSPPRLLAGAAHGGLLPPPARRQRRACPHLSHSTAS
jgi:nitronate monooxygenase